MMIIMYSEFLFSSLSIMIMCSFFVNDFYSSSVAIRSTSKGHYKPVVLSFVYN